MKAVGAAWTGVAAWLPAVFWAFYSLWNTVLPGPPELGRLTAINALYLMMLPAAFVMIANGRSTRVPGQWAYVGLVGWMALGVMWREPVPGVDVPKGLLIAGLAGLIAAQVRIGGRRAEIAFASSVMATAFGLSLWTIGYALESGFLYRSGVPINPNFVATLIGPGVLTATALYVRSSSPAMRAVLMTVSLVSFYASLLLGSRGVIIALVAGGAVLASNVRPRFRQVRGLAAGVAAALVIAQLPQIPHAVWHGGRQAAGWIYGRAADLARPAPEVVRADQPTTSVSSVAVTASTTTGATTASPAVANPFTAAAEAPLNATAARSTALARFAERDVGSFNLRTDLWRAGIVHLASPVTLVIGGGMGTSGLVASRANPVFRNVHSMYLQVVNDYGLVGSCLFVWLFWSVIRRLRASAGAMSAAWLAMLAFWLVTGLTATVTDLHVFWVSLGVAAAAAGHSTIPVAGNRTPSPATAGPGASRRFAERWRAWRTQSVNRGVLAVMLTVGGLTVAVKLVAAVKEAVVARQFGTSDTLDAFLIALVLPQFAINLVGGSLNAALIPTYIRVHERSGTAAAHRLFGSVTALSLAILVLLSVVLALAAPLLMPALAGGFPAWKLTLTETAFRLLLPTLVLTGLTTTWSAVLNASDRFALVASAPVLTSLLTIALVALYGAGWGINALIVATVAGALLEAVALGWALTRRGISLAPRWGGMTEDVRQVVGQYTPMLAGAFLMGSTAVVSQSMAAMLAPGSVSALAYGGKLPALMLGVMALAVSTAVLPPFSRMVAAGDWPGLRHTMRTYVRVLLIATVPVVLLLIALSKPIVTLFFQRGAFTADDTGLVAVTQAMLLLQVPFVVVGTLLVRLISALRANRILMWGSLLNLVVNIGLTYVLMQRMGVIGVALATSLMFVGSIVFLSIAAGRLLRQAARSQTGAADEHG